MLISSLLYMYMFCLIMLSHTYVMYAIVFKTLENMYMHMSLLFHLRRWKRPDIAPVTGLTVLEMHLPTGYMIINDVLRLYVQSGVVPSLSRAEHYDRKVVFYFDYVSVHDAS